MEARAVGRDNVTRGWETVHRILERLLARTVTHPNWVSVLRDYPLAGSSVERVRAFLDGRLVLADAARYSLLDDLSEVYGYLLALDLALIA